MTQHKFKLLTLLLWLCNICIGQQLNFIKYNVYDGLVANPVRCIFQDSKGFIWIGTIDGLSRYDGYKFTNYTTTNGLSHNFINSIIETDGKVMVAENNGSIDIFDKNNFTSQYKTASPVNSISLLKDRLLLSSDANGFYEYKNDSVILPNQQKNSYSLGATLLVGDSLILTAGVDNHFFIYSKDLSHLSIAKNLEFFISVLFQDSKKRIWACTSRGLKLMSIQNGKETSMSFLPLPSMFDCEPLKYTSIMAMVEQEDGSFWFATLNGLVHVFPNGNFYVYDEKNGLPSARVHALYTDKEKNLWIGTTLGLAKWVSRNYVAFFNTVSLDYRNDMMSIHTSKGQKIILKTDDGLQDFSLETKKFIKIKIPGENVEPIPVSGSSPLLVHHHDRLSKYDHEKNIVIPFLKLDTALTGVIAAVEHPQKNIFLGAFAGLYVIKKSIIKDILPYRITRLIVDTDGNIWVGTWRDGLYRITIKKDNDDERYDIVDMSKYVKDKQIRGLYADSKKNIWVGTRYNGAFCLTPKANENYDIQNFSRQSGLMSDWVISFAETKTGDLWVGTYLGLDKLVKETSGFRIFNFSKAVNFFAEIKRIIPVNEHWIGVTNTGIAVFKDEDVQKTAPLKPVIFSSGLGLLDDKLTIVLPAQKISIRPNQNAAKFEFGALGFMNERQILYSYRLKGSGDTSWSKPENIHEASYASLSSGNYTFEVRTLGWNGQYSTSASFSFFIATPFWKQWWFISLCVFALAGLFYALYRYRINQLLRLQTVRNSIATDLHDDIGSSLTNISILSELSSKNLSEPEKAQPFLQRISEEVQTSSQAMDDIIWSVNSRNDSLQETLARMRRYAAELFDNSHIDCHLQLDENAGDKRLSMEQRRDVYLIYKEALNNIHKHANANNVWVDVSQHHNYLSMHIQDDGKGFNTASITHRNGLKNLRSRVEKWNGKIQIGSETGKGATIDIKIPLKE